jgi:hypothetical protein
MGEAINQTQVRGFTRQRAGKIEFLQLTWFGLETELLLVDGERDPQLSRRTFTTYAALAEYVLQITEQALTHQYTALGTHSEGHGSAHGPSAKASTFQPGAEPGERRAILTPRTETSQSKS